MGDIMETLRNLWTHVWAGPSDTAIQQVDRFIGRIEDRQVKLEEELARIRRLEAAADTTVRRAGADSVDSGG